MKFLLVLVIGTFFCSINVCCGKNGTSAKSFSSLNSFSLPTIPSISSISLPTLPSISSVSKPTLPSFNTTGISNLFSTNPFGDFNLFQTFDSLLAMKNQLPNYIAQFGNFSLLQTTLVLALGGIIAGVALVVLEAWSFKHQEDQEYYFKHRIPHFEPYGPSSSYGAPPSSSYGVPYGQSNNRRQEYSQKQQNSPNYNYQSVQQPIASFQSNVHRSHSTDGSSSGGNNSGLRFPNLNKNRKKIMFG